MNIVYEEEAIEDIIEDIKPILNKHWEELANNKEIRPLAVDFDKYIKLNQLGTMKLFTARDENTKLIGYFTFYISNNLHYKDWKYASCDVYYLDPSYRSKGIGKEFVSEMENWLRSLGVKSVVTQDKVTHSHAKFWNKLGYNLVEQTYEKVL